jgi:hypothetical protein
MYIFVVNMDQLLFLIKLRGLCFTTISYRYLLSTQVGAITVIGLNSFLRQSFLHQATQSPVTIIRGIVDPGNVDQAIVDHTEWIEDGSIT